MQTLKVVFVVLALPALLATTCSSQDTTTQPDGVMVHQMTDEEREWVAERTPEKALVYPVILLSQLGTDMISYQKRDSKRTCRAFDNNGLVECGGLLTPDVEIPKQSYLVLVSWVVGEGDGYLGYGITVVFSDASGDPGEDAVFEIVVKEALETPEAVMAAWRDIVDTLKGQVQYDVLNHWSNYYASREFFAWELGERETV